MHHINIIIICEKGTFDISTSFQGIDSDLVDALSFMVL